MKRIAAAVLLAALVGNAAAFATLVQSYYDVSLQAWVCVYRTAQGTTVTRLSQGFCPMSL